MTSQPVRFTAGDGRWVRPMPSRNSSPPYALVADADARRIESIRDAIEPFKIQAVVANDVEEAVAILERRGRPQLLIVDLALTRKDGSQDGLAVIDAAVKSDQDDVPVIGWAPRRELREFALQRLTGRRARVLGASAAPSVVRSAIRAALLARGLESSSADDHLSDADEHVYDTMAMLSSKAQRLCGTSGVAVYLRGSSDAHFRTAVTWLSDSPMPHSPDFLPSVFDAVLATGESFFRTDVTPPPASKEAGVVRGLGAVPLIDTHGVTVGAMCVFDLNPISFSGEVADALRSLGRGIAAPVAPHAATPVARFAGAPAPIETVPPAPVPTRVEHLEPPPPVISIPLLDRTGGDIAVARELARLRREQRHLSVVLFDIDNGYGLDADDALSAEPDECVNEAVVKAIRGTDLAIRWTTDALLIVLPGLAIGEARPVAERVRAALAASVRHRLAVAAGVAELQPNEPFDALVARADDKVRVAREGGHNRVA